MVLIWFRFSGLEWRLYRCFFYVFWKVYIFMKKKILLFMLYKIVNIGIRNYIE